MTLLLRYLIIAAAERLRVEGELVHHLAVWCDKLQSERVVRSRRSLVDHPGDERIVSGEDIVHAVVTLTRDLGLRTASDGNDRKASA